MTPLQRSRKRRRAGRIQLSAVLVLLSLANGLFWLFTVEPNTPWLFLRGPIAGGQISVIVVGFALWERQIWARLLLLGLNWVMIALFGAFLLRILNAPSENQTHSLEVLIGGLALYVAANIILIRSEMIERLTHRQTSGGA